MGAGTTAFWWVEASSWASTSTRKGRLLVTLLVLRSRLEAQPQRDVSWLHSLPHYPSRSSLKAARFVSLRNLAERASSVFAASYLLR
jgi:hypothetical protein